jgi:rhombotail lipoprotein
MKPASLLRAVTVLSSVSALAGCSVAPQRAAMAPAAVAAPEPPPVLKKSLYAKDGSGAVGEDDLQTILASPIDLQFPARVGVVPLAAPFDASGKVSIAMRSLASRDLAAALRGHPDFSQVSDVSTELPNTGGIEGLRIIAARYRLRYLLLFSARIEDETHANGWAFTYPTILGMFVTPGVTVQSKGFVQADMLDVRTGTILFSVVEPMSVSQQSFMVGAGRTHKELQAEAAAEASKRLARKIGAQTNALVAFADSQSHGAHAQKRVLPAPVAMDE